MKALRLIVAFALLIIAIPAWRFVDWSIIFWPNDYLFGSLLTAILVLLIILPIWMIYPKMPKPFLGFLFGISFIPFIMNPLSQMSTTNGDFSHCGSGSFTGTLYPIKHLVPYVQEYDLEIRNQLCWIRKMIKRAPKEFGSQHEFNIYSELLKKKLMSPHRKYKVSLIGLYFLLSHIGNAWRPDGVMDKFSTKKNFVNGMIEWYGIYDFEIRDIEFRWYDRPYSDLLRLEYGWVEKNIRLN